MLNASSLALGALSYSSILSLPNETVASTIPYPAGSRCGSARRNSFVKPEELDASNHEVKTEDHVITRRKRLVDLSISIKALYYCTAAGSSTL